MRAWRAHAATRTGSAVLRAPFRWALRQCRAPRPDARAARVVAAVSGGAVALNWVGWSDGERPSSTWGEPVSAHVSVLPSGRVLDSKSSPAAWLMLPSARSVCVTGASLNTHLPGMTTRWRRPWAGVERCRPCGTETRPAGTVPCAPGKTPHPLVSEVTAPVSPGLGGRPLLLPGWQLPCAQHHAGAVHVGRVCTGACSQCSPLRTVGTEPVGSVATSLLAQ